MPPVAFLNVRASTAAPTTSFSVLTPSVVKPGDSLLLFVWSADTSLSALATTNLPAGWSVLSNTQTTGRQQAALLRRIVTDSEPPSHTFAVVVASGGTLVLPILLAYRGLDPGANLVDAAVAEVTTATTAFNCGSLTLGSYADLYLGIEVDRSTGTATVPAATTERVDAANTNPAAHLTLFDLIRESSGPTGVQTITISTASTGLVAAYALKALPPLPAPATTPDVPGAIGFVTVGV